MAFGLFRKRLPEPAAPAAATASHRPSIAADTPQAPESDSAREILELLELELGAMIRQLERAANSVAGGAEATAATLSTIRQRTDALTGRTSAAQSTATTFSLAADKFTHSAQGIGSQVRDASKLADQASAAAREASLNVDRLRESSAAIGNVVNLIAQIARQTTLLGAQLHHRGGPRRFRRTRFCGRRHRGQGAGGADPERDRGNFQEDRRAAEGCRGFGRRGAPDFAGDRSDPPGIRNRQWRRGGADRNHRRDIRNAATASNFIVSVSESAAEIDTVTKQAEAHGESVASAGKAVTMFAQKLKSRCAVLLRQNERKDQKAQPLPCNLAIEIQTPRGMIAAPAYEISIDGILIGGPDAEKLPLNEPFNATLEDVGACRIRLRERTKAGAQARFEAPEAALKEKIEDKLWSIQDENTESVTRAMEAGRALTRIFDDAVRSRATPWTTCSMRTTSKSPAPIRCSTAPGCWTGPIARCHRSRRLS